MKKKLIIAVAIVLMVGVVVAIALSGQGTGKAIENVLENYFSAYFTTASVKEIQACLPEELREDANLAYTLGGTMNLLINNKLDMITKLGEPYTVSVKIVSKTNPSAQQLNAMRQKYYGATMAITADFEVTVHGKDKSVHYTSTAPMVKIGSAWFMAQHSLPLYEK